MVFYIYFGPPQNWGMIEWVEDDQAKCVGHPFVWWLGDDCVHLVCPD